MTEQTITEQTAADLQTVREGVNRARRESDDRLSRIAAAWESPEARAVAQVVREDGNVDWREFVGHVGGILKVVELVDDQGRPDTDRIIPLVDELFGKHAKKQLQGGMTMTLGPRNRPYRRPASLR